MRENTVLNSLGDEGKWMRLMRRKILRRYLRLSTYNLRLTTYDLQLTTYNLRLTTYDLQLTTYNLQLKKGIAMLHPPTNKQNQLKTNNLD